MAPYFETVKSFADVHLTESGVNTVQFLDASDGLVTMFDLLGVGVFSFVQADIRSNIHGVRNAYSLNPAESETLEQLALREAHDGNDRHKHGIGCLRRLLRGLLFTCRALQNSRANETEDLQTSFRKAYDTVLKHHHGFAVRTVVSIALRSTPSKQTFYTRLAQSSETSARQGLNTALGRWLDALDVLVVHMAGVYEKEGWGKV